MQPTIQKEVAYLDIQNMQDIRYVNYCWTDLGKATSLLMKFSDDTELVIVASNTQSGRIV